MRYSFKTPYLFCYFCSILNVLTFLLNSKSRETTFLIIDQILVVYLSKNGKNSSFSNVKICCFFMDFIYFKFNFASVSSIKDFRILS